MKPKSLALLAVWVAILAASHTATASSESNRTPVFLRPGEMSFWHTATNSVIALPVDMPPLATAGTLTVRGVRYEREYAIASSGDFMLSLPVADSPQSENVYDLTLSFDDGMVRTAKLGLVRGYAKGGSAATRLLAPKDGAKWKGVTKRAVLPISFGTSSVLVNGVETDTGLGGDQGWFAVQLKNAHGRISTPEGDSGMLRYVVDFEKPAADHSYSLLVREGGEGKIRFGRVSIERMD